MGRRAVATLTSCPMFKRALFLLPAAALWLSPGSAVAQLTKCAAGSVCYYVALQPIDVCTDSGTGCAPFNTVNATGSPGTVGPANPIGFVDSATGKDITRAMWNQIGVDIAWSPMRQLNSTANQTIGITCTGTDSTTCSNTLDSSQFKTLSDQPTMTQAGSPSPSPPLSSSKTVLNMFFVSKINPPSLLSGILYGFSWIGNNGIAIAGNTFTSSGLTLPRFDTLAHEIGHNLGLNHGDTYNTQGWTGATSKTPCTNSTSPAYGLMTTGSSRFEPTSTSIALADLKTGDGAGTAGQLNRPSTTTPCTTDQQTEVSLSAFLNPIASSTTIGTATAPTTAAAVSVATNNTTSTPSSNAPITFDTTAPALGTGRVGGTLVGLTLTIGPTLTFDKKNKVDFFSTSGNKVGKFKYDTGKLGDVDCPIPGTECVIIKLNTGLSAGDPDLQFSQGILTAQKVEATLCQLEQAPTTATYFFNDGLVITSQLTGSCGGGRLTANSQQPVNNVNIAVQPQIDPAAYAAAGPPTPAPPCSPLTEVTPGVPPDPTTTTCPALVIADGDPTKEGGQPQQIAGLLSCTPSGALSALLQPSTVVAYVPNSGWSGDQQAPGVQVVPIEPAGGTPTSIIGITEAINSCASNSTTGQTVCTANNNHVYLLSGASVTNILTSNAVGQASFTGGVCTNCGLAINQATNTAAIAMSLSTDGATGLQFLNLSNNAFSSPPTAAVNKVSEGSLWDPTRNLILSPNEVGVFDLFSTASSPTKEYANSTVGGELDSAAADCTTGIALASDEGTSPSRLYFADLTQARFVNDGSTWTAGGTPPAAQFVSFPEFNFMQSGTFPIGTSGIAVAPRSHLAVVAGEFGGNKFGVVQLPSDSGVDAGTPNFRDYVAALLPPVNGTLAWSQGRDPHGVTAYVSPNDGKAYALMANGDNIKPTYLAVIDMQALLNAPRVTTPTGPHNVCQIELSMACNEGATPVDLVATGIVRYVATGN